QSVLSHSHKEAKSASLMDAFAETEQQSVRRTGGFRQTSDTPRPEQKPKKSIVRRKKQTDKKKKVQSKRRRITKRLMLVAGVFVLLLGSGLVIRAVLLGNN